MEQKVIKAVEAPYVRKTTNVTMKEVMEAVERRSGNGYGHITYDVMYDVFEDGVIEQLVELGYRVKLDDYKTSAFITITWEDDNQRIQRIQNNIPKALRP